MRSVTPFLPQASQIGSALRRSLTGAGAPTTTTPAVTKPAAGTTARADSATLSADSQALLDQPEAQQKKVLSLLDSLFGITNVASMALNIDVSHAHASQASSQEQQSNTDHGLTYQYQDFAQEADTTALNASGTITLADGRTFNLDLQYQRSVTVTTSRSVNLAVDAPTTAGAAKPDLSGSGKRWLDQLFPAADVAKNLGQALRQLTATIPSNEPTTPPSLSASIDVSPLSTAALNEVFGRLRDQLQQRRADLFAPSPATDTNRNVDVYG